MASFSICIRCAHTNSRYVILCLGHANKDMRAVAATLAASWTVSWRFAFFGQPTDDIAIRYSISVGHCIPWIFPPFLIALRTWFWLFSRCVCLLVYHIVYTVFVISLFHISVLRWSLRFLCTLTGWLSSLMILFFMSCCRHRLFSSSPHSFALMPLHGSIFSPPPFLVYVDTGTSAVIWDWPPLRGLFFYSLAAF